MKREHITEGLDLLGDWLDAKGYTEEAGLCTRAMDEINRLMDEIEEWRRLPRSEIKRLRAENARLLKALKNWDALIRHQYTGSREAMSDMTDCAQETAKLLFGDDPWPKIEARAAMGESDE